MISCLYLFANIDRCLSLFVSKVVLPDVRRAIEIARISESLSAEKSSREQLIQTLAIGECAKRGFG